MGQTCDLQSRRRGSLPRSSTISFDIHRKCLYTTDKMRTFQMALPYLKYYIENNPDYIADKGEFIPPTREEYEEYFETMNGYNPGKAIHTYELYVERMKAAHERPDAPLQLNKAAIDGNNEEGSIKEVEKSENFIRWYEPNVENIE